MIDLGTNEAYTSGKSCYGRFLPRIVTKGCVLLAFRPSISGRLSPAMDRSYHPSPENGGQTVFETKTGITYCREGNARVRWTKNSGHFYCEIVADSDIVSTPACRRGNFPAVVEQRTAGKFPGRQAGVDTMS